MNRPARAAFGEVEALSTAQSARLSADASIAGAAYAGPHTKIAPRHSLLVRITHWVTAASFVALVVSGLEILISHPRFYWGETGSVLTAPLFTIPIPSSRHLVPTGYGFVLPDQNGWSRALHFQSAWVLVLTGLLYAVASVITGHFRKDLFPGKFELTWRSLVSVIKSHLRTHGLGEQDPGSYNALQKLTYLSVIFILFPIIVWTGLAMSPAFTSAFPWTVELLGGRQSARTLHFAASIASVLFVLSHIVLVWSAGFVSRVRSMVSGRVSESKEQP